MFREAAEAAAAVRRQSDAVARRIGARLRALAPHTVVTCARGSSDHAATYAKYLIETRLGIPTASAAPSVSSLYAARARLDGVVCIAISQSGVSPDLLAVVDAARAGGALVIALVNDVASPLAALADEVLPLCAGSEISVAATKSYIASLAAILSLVAHWSEDAELLDAHRALPDLLEESWALDWSPMVAALREASSLYVLGRGVGLGIAQEAALKFKETCRLHAEAFSAAEVRHGPMALVRPGFPILLFRQGDETSDGIDETLSALQRNGARLLVAGEAPAGAIRLPVLRASPVIEPLLQIQSFYRAANFLSLARGLDPDLPPHLAKVTETM